MAKTKKGVDKLDLLLVVAIVLFALAFFNLMLSIKNVSDMKKVTGHTTDSGNASVEVLSTASINFTVDVLDWGAGAVNVSGGYENCTLISDGTVSGGNWTAQSSGLYIENIGNVNVTLDLNANNSAATFIGGGGGATPDPLYQGRISNNETEACTIANYTDYQDLNTTVYRTCDSFWFEDANDSIELDIKLNIPQDAPPGEKISIITATAEVI